MNMIYITAHNTTHVFGEGGGLEGCIDIQWGRPSDAISGLRTVARYTTPFLVVQTRNSCGTCPPQAKKAGGESHYSHGRARQVVCRYPVVRNQALRAKT